MPRQKKKKKASDVKNKKNPKSCWNNLCLQKLPNKQMESELIYDWRKGSTVPALPYLERNFGLVLPENVSASSNYNQKRKKIIKKHKSEPHRTGFPFNGKKCCISSSLTWKCWKPELKIQRHRGWSLIWVDNWLPAECFNCGYERLRCQHGWFEELTCACVPLCSVLLRTSLPRRCYP